MADHSELMRLVESLNRAIEQAEHKPGQWAETAQSMGGICCAGEPFQIGKPWAKEDPWAHFSYKRDSWLAVAAVNALPQLMGLIAENERLIESLRETREDRNKIGDRYDAASAEIEGLKIGYEAYEQVNAGLKAENETLVAAAQAICDEWRKDQADAERYRWLRDQCGIVEYQAIAGSIGSGMLPSGESLDAALSVAMGKGEQS